MNEPRIRIYDKFFSLLRNLFGLVLSGFVVQVAFADTGLPPPAVHQTTNNGFPSSQALKNQGYDPSRGVLKVNETNNGKPKVTSSGGTITGTQNKTVTVTGRYGEKGTMQTTTTQKVNSGTLQTALSGTLAAGTALGGAIGSDFAANAYEDIRNGNYGSAVRNVVGAVIEGLSKLDITGIGSGINNFLDKTNLSGNSSEGLTQAAETAAKGQAAAEQAGDFAGAVANAAAKKAAEGAAKDARSREEFEKAQEKSQSTNKPVYGLFFSISGQKEQSAGIYVDEIPTRLHSWGVVYNDGKKVPFDTGVPELEKSYAPDSVDKKIVSIVYNWRQVNNKQYEPAITSNEITLNSSEIQAILNRMLENQQTNHAELMNQLAKIGDAVAQSTESQSWDEKTVTTEPFTPAGSDTPQQTQFTIDKDGNVTATTIQRPDLKPNSSQAPTRTEVIKNGTSTQTGQTGEQTNTQNGTQQTGQQQGQTQQQQQQKDFCEQNPNAAACAPLGESDYEDLDIPMQTIDLNFQPSNHFTTTGVCPAPRSVDFGMFGTHEFSYELLCDFAAKIRPILIAITILSCAWFVSGALKEV